MGPLHRDGSHRSRIEPDGTVVERHDTVRPQCAGDLDESLESREATVLRMRFGLGMPQSHTLKEIGTQLGLTRERVRQLLMGKSVPAVEETIVGLDGTIREVEIIQALRFLHVVDAARASGPRATLHAEGIGVDCRELLV